MKRGLSSSVAWPYCSTTGVAALSAWSRSFPYALIARYYVLVEELSTELLSACQMIVKIRNASALRSGGRRLPAGVFEQLRSMAVYGAEARALIVKAIDALG